MAPLKREEVEEAHRNFYEKRVQVKACGDFIWRLQMKRAASYLIALQAEDGHWPADTAFPQIYIPPLNEDGGWGVHCAGHNTMFCTVLNYVCLRILGVKPDEGDDNTCPRARKWILDHGSATHIPSWGKTWLCILGLYDWSGCNPMPPELLLLPTFLPMHIGMIKENPSGDFNSMYPHISKGAWSFCDRDEGWQVSDCTADALKCCLMLSTMPPEIVGKKMDPERLYDSVNVLLSLQSKNGWFTAWEEARGYKWLEAMNTTSFFTKVVVEHEYVECTSSIIQALVLFKKLYPSRRKNEIETSISKAVKYIESCQYPNGSWRQIGSSGSSSSRSVGWGSPKLKCKCGVEAVIRTVRNGDNVESDCGFFQWVNANKMDLEDLRFQVFERDTQVAEKEIEIDFMKEQLKKFEKNLGVKEDELNDTKMELCHTRIELMKASRNEKNFSIALFVSWIFFAFLLVYLKA
uniref:Squalene cyclase N-terminal domain-containing protein n=1 Tax=Chenopodium quinoa TaxID=63459 RepID=A0A803KQK9_CHEQI